MIPQIQMSPLILLLIFRSSEGYPEILDEDLTDENITDNFISLFDIDNENLTIIELLQAISLNITNVSSSMPILTEMFLDLVTPNTWTWFLIFCHCVVFAVGLVGNCLVCVAVYRNHSMRTVTNYFIVNLAVADFLVILFCLPPSVIWDVTMTWWFGTGLCKVVLYLQSMSVTVSVLTLTFISLDRWYAICYPLKFKSTTGKAKTAIVIIWVIAMVCEIPEPISLRAVPFIANSSVKVIYFTQCKPEWSNDVDMIFITVKMVFFFLIPLLFMIVAYSQIVRVLWKSGEMPHQVMNPGGRVNMTGGQLNTFAMNTNTSTEGQLKSRKKAAKMLVVVVGMFAICIFPVNLLAVLRAANMLFHSDLNQILSLMSHWLCYANSAINPIIYNFMSGKFRKEFRRAFETCCQRESRRQHYYSGGTFYHKDSGFASRSQSKSDNEKHKLSTFRDRENMKLIRKSTRTTVVQVDI